MPLRKVKDGDIAPA
jgi:predicted  nucleic acid-binding Zn-ribbon protein